MAIDAGLGGVAFLVARVLFGGLLAFQGINPAIAAGAVAVFLLATTPLMHNFWAVPDDQQQAEMTNFIKNVELLGGALVFLVLSKQSWAYALGVSLGL